MVEAKDPEHVIIGIPTHSTNKIAVHNCYSCLHKYLQHLIISIEVNSFTD